MIKFQTVPIQNDHRPPDTDSHVVRVHPRTIKEAATWFKAQDPDTALTETAIRRLVRTGEVPSVRVGRKYLVNLEALESYLAGQAGTRSA